MIREAICRLVDGLSLTEDEASGSMSDIMSGEATQAQIGAFLAALRIKGETVHEIAGMAKVMREKALGVVTTGRLLDTCGTGGDGLGTFNISTAVALVAASAGLKVAKHGNRAASGTCGSADILESHGVKIALGPEGVKKCLEEVGIGFMFAPVFHPAMKYAIGPRREIGIRTVFNILGPLTNPAKTQVQVMGVADRAIAPKIAEVLGRLGVEKAMVVHGEEGLDEISICGPSHVWELSNGDVRNYSIKPEDFDIRSSPLDTVKAQTLEDHARIFEEVLRGVDGPTQDIVVINAAAALMVGDKVSSLDDGVSMARQILRSGAALEKLNHFALLSQELNDR